MYLNDKKHGICKKFYPNGNLLEMCIYLNDKKNGQYKTYFENGKILQYYIYVDGKCDISKYYRKKW